MYHLTLFVTAHSEKERLEWEERFVERILQRASGCSIYDGHGAYRMKDGSIMQEPHSRIEVLGKSAHEIHQLYSWIHPTLLEYYVDTQQECALVLMNGSMSFVGSK